MKPRPGFTYPTWKRGYEAQHIIPYAVAAKLGLPLSLINEAWNGMMLPSGRRGAAMPGYKRHTRFMNRPRHILKGFAHPVYSRQVEALITRYMAIWRIAPGQMTAAQMRRVADYLRMRTKLLPATRAIDEMRLSAREAANI